MVVTMQRGDILIGNDRDLNNVYTGINLEVWRDGVFQGLLEPSLAHGWNIDPFAGNTERIGVDRDGNVYAGGSSSNATNGGTCIYTWDSAGVWRGKERIVVSGAIINSPWGNDIGLVTTDGIWPDSGALFPRDCRCHWIHGTRDGHLYITRWRHNRGDNLFVQGPVPIPAVYAVSKYDITGNPVQKYNATLEWSPVVDAGTSFSTNVDILAAVVTCDERYFVCVSQGDHLIGGGIGPQLLRYDITDPTDQVATLLYQSTFADFSGLAIDSVNDKVIVLNSFTEDPPTIKRVSVDGSVIETITLNGVPAFILNLQYYLSSNQIIVSADGGVFLVDITKPDGAGDAWSTPSATPLFTTLGKYMVMGVYDPLRCEAGVSSVFGTVIGAT